MKRLIVTFRVNGEKSDRVDEMSVPTSYRASIEQMVRVELSERYGLHPDDYTLISYI